MKRIGKIKPVKMHRPFSLGADQSAPNETWSFRDRPLKISLAINTILFSIMFFYFSQEKPVQQTTVTLTPLEDRYSAKSLQRKKKRVEKKRRQIKQKVARENARNRAVPTRSSEMYTAPVRESDDAAPKTGQTQPMAQSRRPNFQYNDYTQAENVGRPNTPNGYGRGPTGPIPEYHDSHARSSGGPVREVGQPANGPVRAPSSGKKSWGGPGSEGSRLVYSPNPGYPQSLQEGGIQGQVKVKVFFLPDGRVYEVRILSVADSQLVSAVRQKVMKWRASPSHLGGTRYLQTTFIFSL